MTATYEQIITEANRRAAEPGWGARPVEHLIIEVVREGWAPPEPVDPDLQVVREIAAKQYKGAEAVVSADIRLGKYDGDAVLICALAAYKAGKAAQ
jgi:hypothetical protein